MPSSRFTLGFLAAAMATAAPVASAAAQAGVDPAMATRASMLAREGRRPDATAMLGKYLATAPGDGRAWLTLGRFYLLDAREWHLRNHETDPGAALLLDLAGSVLVQAERLALDSALVMRGVVDLGRLGERTITVDCDVLQADGGTRTASITGGYVALAAALITYGMERLLVGKVAAVSVGIVEGAPYLDLDYSEDSHAEVDFNVVGTDKQTYVEVQGTAEGKPFDRAGMDSLLGLADAGLQQLFRYQRTVLGRE